MATSTPFLRGLAAAAGLILARAAAAAPLPDGAPVRGWTILAGSERGAREVIAAAPAYGINHLELSQEILSDLRQLADPARRARVSALAGLAHAAGVAEVALWDHPLYELSYYPARFRAGPGGLLDLGDPAFWDWFRADYRRMLERAPWADAVVLTFTNTPGKVESQAGLGSEAARQAALVNAVADVVVGERRLNLYVRLFPNDAPRDPRLTAPFALIARPQVRLMIKQSPLDYFLTAPSDGYIGALGRPTVVEFELTGEFNGEGEVANTFVENVLARWRDFARRPGVIGYTVRTDRLGESRLVGKPGEVNLWALKRGAEDPQVTAEQVYAEFIGRRYGDAARPGVEAAFKKAYDIVTSAYYTLGTPLSDHSQLSFDQFPAVYTHLISGRWMDPPIARVGHGVDREFHYWRDVADHLAPPFVKDPAYLDRQDFLTPEQRAAYHPGEAMDERWLCYVATEKDHGVELARAAAADVESARAALAPADYAQLRAYFERTLLSARLYRGAAEAYFGFRVWCRGEGFRTPFVEETVRRGLAEIREVAPRIRDYPVPPPAAQYVWAGDAARAERLFDLIARQGWPARSEGVANPNAGMIFPLDRPVTGR